MKQSYFDKRRMCWRRRSLWLSRVYLEHMMIAAAAVVTVGIVTWAIYIILEIVR